MNCTKVFWLLDDTTARTHPKDWDEVAYLSSKLINLIGNKGLEHLVVEPLESYKKALGKLLQLSNDIRVTTIIDISCWIGFGLKPLFPEAEVVTDFSLSRILDVSTRDFQTVGYITNRPQDEISSKAAGLDLSKVLIVDDTGMTGGTNYITMEAFGIRPRDTTHFLLLANTGNCPTPESESISPGAVDFLEGLGSKVLYGDSLKIPEDDAEHLSDMFRHPYLRKVFPVAFRLHANIIDPRDYGEQLQKFILMDGCSRDLFPQQVDQSEISRLSLEGRFVQNTTHTPSKHSVYSRNPLLWAFNDFWKKIDESSLQARGDDVLSILERLQLLSSNPEGIFEARQALQRETENLISKKIIEGIVTRREREI